MASSRHCRGCGCRWPEGYAHCPACLRATAIVRREPNRSPYQAAEAEFNRLYQEREVRRITEGRIAPEGLGKREAREIIRLERCLGDEAA